VCQENAGSNEIPKTYPTIVSNLPSDIKQENCATEQFFKIPKKLVVPGNPGWHPNLDPGTRIFDPELRHVSAALLNKRQLICQLLEIDTQPENHLSDGSMESANDTRLHGENKWHRIKYNLEDGNILTLGTLRNQVFTR